VTLLPQLEFELRRVVDRDRSRRRRARTLLAAAPAAALLLTATAFAGTALLAHRRIAPQAHRALPVLGTSHLTSLAAYRGAPLVVTFYAAWCAPCRAQARTIGHIPREHAVLLSFVDRPQDALGFVRASGLRLPVLGDPNHAMADAYRVDAVPRTLVLDAHGRIAATFRGTIDRSQLIAAVRQARRMPRDR
jgi:thiol-disulfide isomerase/thioredoxin